MGKLKKIKTDWNLGPTVFHNFISDHDIRLIICLSHDSRFVINSNLFRGRDFLNTE